MRLVDWEYLRNLLEEKLNIPGDVLDFIAVKDILQLCASGSSTFNISRFIDVEEEYVTQIVKQYLKFDGWDVDRDLNPYIVYKNIRDYELPREAFDFEVRTLVPYYKEEEINLMYNIAETYYKIEEEMEKYWI